MIRILLTVILVGISHSLLANSYEVRERLESMMDADQAYRTELGGLKPGSRESEELWKKQRQIDEQNIKELEKNCRGAGMADAITGWP